MPDYGRWTSNGGDPNLNDINRADRFIEALSTNQSVYATDPAEAELAFLLADWRDGVRETPVSGVITERDAVTALNARQATRRPNRLSLAVIGSAAAAVLCVGGFGVAVYGAGPGDGLYGLRAMIFGEQQVARQDQVVLAAQQELAQVQQLVDQGQWEQAQNKLVALSDTVQNVGAIEQKHDLVEQWNALTYKVVEQDPAATLPPAGEPAPVLLPNSPLTLLPVPVVTSTTTAPGSEVLLTPPSTTSATPTTSASDVPTSTTATSTTGTSATPSPSDVPSPTTATTTTAPTTTTTATTTATTVAPPPSSTPPPTTTTTTAAVTTTTTTLAATTSRQPVPAPSEAPSQTPTRVTSSAPAAQPPAPEATTTVAPGTGRSTAEVPVTTTSVVPRG